MVGTCFYRGLVLMSRQTRRRDHTATGGIPPFARPVRLPGDDRAAGQAMT